MDNIAEKFGLSSAWVTDLEKNGKHYDAYSIYKKDKSGYTLSNSYTQENAQLVLDELKKQYPNIEAQLTSRQYKYAPEMKKEVLLVVQTDVDDLEDNEEINASLKKKAVDEKIKEACYYIAEQGSQDNNAEQGLEDMALEEAPRMFGVDEDLLDEEWDKNRNYYFDTLFQYQNKKGFF